MKKFLKWFERRFHNHEWDTIETTLVKITDHYIVPDGTPVGYKYVEIQKCKICGKIRKQIIKI